MSETPLGTQELQYPSDFSTASSSSVLVDSENLQKEISTLESSYEAPLDMQELEYWESVISSCSTKHRSESSSNESIILDFSKTAQKIKFPADLVTFTEEILNGKLHFLCSGS